MDAVKELDTSPDEVKGYIATRLYQIKRWLLSHSQQLNFFTILVLASVSSKISHLPYLSGILTKSWLLIIWVISYALPLIIFYSMLLPNYSIAMVHANPELLVSRHSVILSINMGLWDEIHLLNLRFCYIMFIKPVFVSIYKVEPSFFFYLYIMSVSDHLMLISKLCSLLTRCQILFLT